MNCVLLYGSLGAPPEYYISAKGVPSVKWSLAVRPRRGNGVNWVQCITYGAHAEIIHDQYGTGDFMLIKDGELTITKRGESPPYWMVRVRLIEHLSKKARDTINYYQPDQLEDKNG